MRACGPPQAKHPARYVALSRRLRSAVVKAMDTPADLDIPIEAHEEAHSVVGAVVGLMCVVTAVALYARAMHGASEAMRGGEAGSVRVAALALWGMTHALIVIVINGQSDSLIRHCARPYLAPLKVKHTHAGRLPRVDLGLFQAPGHAVWDVAVGAEEARDLVRAARPRYGPPVGGRVRPCP